MSQKSRDAQENGTMASSDDVKCILGDSDQAMVLDIMGAPAGHPR